MSSAPTGTCSNHAHRRSPSASSKPPHTVDLDEIGAVEIGRLEALIEAIDADLAERGLTHKRGDMRGEVRSLVDLRLRASRRLAEWLDRYGLNPQTRSEWAAKLARPSFMEQ